MEVIKLKAIESQEEEHFPKEKEEGEGEEEDVERRGRNEQVRLFNF